MNHIFYRKTTIFGMLSVICGLSMLSLFLLNREHKLTNLTIAKERVIQYYDSGAFEREVRVVVDKAINHLKNHACEGKRPTVVFDVDDTLLWYYYKMKDISFGYVPDIFNQWLVSSIIPTVPHVKDLYDFCVERGYEIVFLTGHHGKEGPATIKHLKNLGFTKIDQFIMRGEHELTLSALEFKSNRRKLLEEQGCTIIAAVGDQESDLIGGYNCYKVKIPNYTYILY